MISIQNDKTIFVCMQSEIFEQTQSQMYDIHIRFPMVSCARMPLCTIFAIQFQIILVYCVFLS